MIVHSTPKAPAAVGPYSQAVEANGFLFLSGQIALQPETGQLTEGGIRAQTKQVFLNLEAVLLQAGMGLDRVVKTTCFLTDLMDFPAFNEIYSEHFGTHRPARSTVEVGALPKGALVEVEAVAVRE